MIYNDNNSSNEDNNKDNDNNDDNDIIYKEKYLKYKQKYLDLKGGGFNIFSQTTNQTASYIYTIDTNGVYYFAICRKVQRGARQRLGGTNTGAAGTDEKYWGKWGSLGGGASKKLNCLEAAISEINHEANINAVIGYDWKPEDIYISWMPRGSPRKNEPKLLYAIDPNDNKKLSIYLFFIEDKKTFFRLFPKLTENIRRGADIVTTSQGETDAVASVSIENMISYQKYEIKYYNNNFFQSYFCDTFDRIIKTQIIQDKGFNRIKNYTTDIPFVSDRKERIPYEFPAKKNEYVEGPPRRYKNRKYYMMGLLSYV
jgi:hypothetical protein